jgi:hypothetical protein
MSTTESVRRGGSAVQAPAVYTFNGADHERLAALDHDFLKFLTTWNRGEEPGRTEYTAEYLLLTERRR